MKKLLLFTLLICVVSSFAFAEKILEGRAADDAFKGAVLVRYKDNVSIPAFVRFSDGNGPMLVDVERWLASNYALDEGLSLDYQKTDEDALGFSHVHFNQFFDGIKIDFAKIIVHAIGGRVVSINGYAANDAPMAAHAMDESSALNLALNHVGASTYKWEDKLEEALLKKETGKMEATYFPKGEKVFLPENASFTSGNLIPCWKFDIYASLPLYRAYVYVDANSGLVAFENQRIKDVDSNSTAKTSYSGIRPIVSDYYNQTNFRLREASRGNGVETYDMVNGTSHGAAVDITSDSSYWHDTLRIKYATDAHWGAEMVYDYYMNVHGRNSIDDNGLKLLSYVHYSNNYANAFWDGQRMTYGDGSGGITAMTTLDISGHEITHGVDQYTSNLVYSYESGALDESFADIFGNAIEAHYKPDAVKNWLVGEEIGTNFRSMSNPKSKTDPDTYLGTYWYTGAADNGGVHTNSGVQNHWFYLLSVGGSGTNDNSDVYSVIGLGISKAEKIAYRNRAVYLTSTSDYADARFYSIQSAFDLYGPCSPELASTVNAWYAVGVGAAYSNTVLSDFDASVTEICTLPAQVNFKNLSNYNAVTYLWDFGDGNTSTLKDPVHTYASPGNYTVELTSIGNSTCGSDVETKNNFISVTPPSDIQATPYSICEGYAAKISINAPDNAFWFTDSIADDPIFVGSPFVTAPLFKDTVFYAANGVLNPSKFVGPTSNAIGTGGSFAGYRYLVFDVLDKMTLQTVRVYSYAATSRTIELRNSTGVVLQSKTVTVPTGEQVIELNFKIDPGTDYQLGVNINSSADFFRNSTGAVYPYTLAGLVSITSAGNAPPSYYYFFYDWKVKGYDCIGKRFPVDVTIDTDPNCIPYAGINETSAAAELTIYPNPSNGKFNVSFDLKEQTYLTFRLIDSKGASLNLLSNRLFEKGRNTYSIDEAGLSKGVYVLQINGDNLSETRRLVIR